MLAACACKLKMPTFQWQWSVLVLLTSLTISTARVLIGELPNEAHDVRGSFYVDDAHTFSIDHFYYDGRGPAAFPYYYERGETPNRHGGGVIFPATPTSDRFTRRYTDEDIVLPLPEGVTVCDIGWFTIWCRNAWQFFTRIRIPENVVNCEEGGGEVEPTEAGPPMEEDFDNCVMLDAGLRVFWSLNRTSEVAHFMLCGCVTNEDSSNQYMGFGLSGSTSDVLMFGADPVITWVDDETGANAEDYYLSNYVQCRQGVGACPDIMDSSNTCQENVFDVAGFKENGMQCVAYSKPFSTGDSRCDRTIDPDNTEQYVVWGIGGLGLTAFKHFKRASMGDSPLHLGREPRFQCSSALQCLTCDSFEPNQIRASENTVFHARIGPSGADRGYMAITGVAGWGIAWYINGLLIPELVLERGYNYTFIVEGGNDPTIIADYHPFYITNSASGGRLLNSAEQMEGEVTFAGFDESDSPLGVGRLCQYDETEEATELLATCSSQMDYTNALVLNCSEGQAGEVVFSPDETTPDVVYYQCASHLNLGWRITVTDSATTLLRPWFVAMVTLMTAFAVVL